MGDPLVSIVIPAFNAERFLAEAVESALSQTLRALEIIVVDDGSTDGTARIAMGFGDQIRYLHQPNSRQAAARNRGIREARGELLAFLDADDVWRRDKLQKQLAVLERHPSAGLVYSGIEVIDADGTPVRQRLPEPLGDQLSAILLGNNSGLFAGSTMLVRRAALVCVGLFDENLPPCEDTDLCWRIATRYSVRFVAEPLVRYRLHSGNTHANVANSTRAWKLLYRKALSDPYVRSRGRVFRARCRGRLYYMLAGDHARSGQLATACWYGLLGMMFWPPNSLRVLSRLTARRWVDWTR